MADGGNASVLRRKAEQGRAGSGEAKGPPGPGKALADAIRRAAEVELELAVTVGEARERRATPAELLETLPEHAFLGLLLGPENGAGLFVLYPAALSAVIETRTMGRVSTRPALPRRPTKTDAAMVSDVLDRILAEFEAPLMETDAARWAAGWRYQLLMADPRPLAVVLEEATHRILECEVLFGAAAKPGQLLLALPATGRARPKPAAVPDTATAAGEAKASWQRGLGEAVGNAEVTLDAVLGRIRLSLAELAALAPGDRLALPLTALGAVKLTVAGGAAVSEARLGQTGGLRAVKIGDREAAAGTSATDASVIAAGSLVTSGQQPAGPHGRFEPAAGLRSGSLSGGDPLDGLDDPAAGAPEGFHIDGNGGALGGGEGLMPGELPDPGGFGPGDR